MRIKLFNPEKEERRRLLKQAGRWGSEKVYSTADQSSYKTKKRFDTEHEVELKKDQAVKEQKNNAEWEKGPRGEVWKK